MADTRQMERRLVALELSVQFLLKHMAETVPAGRKAGNGAKKEAIAAALVIQANDTNVPDGLAAQVEAIFAGVQGL